MPRTTKLQLFTKAVERVTDEVRHNPLPWDAIHAIAYMEGSAGCYDKKLEAALNALRKQLSANELARMKQHNRQQ